MRDVSISQSGRILEAYDAKATGDQKAGIAAYGGKLGGVAKFFGYAVDVNIGGKTITVNKKSLEKYISRHGGEFHSDKKMNAQQLGEMIKKVAPNWERDSVIKQLARTEDLTAKDGDQHGAMWLKSDKVQDFLNTLSGHGISIPSGMIESFKPNEKGEVKIEKKFVDELRDNAKKLMSDEGIGQSEWTADTQKAHAARTSGWQKPSEPVTSKNFEQKFKGLHIGASMGTPEKMKAFFEHEGSKELIEFAKENKAAAKKLVKALVGEGEGEKGMHKQAANWYGRLSADQKEDLAAIMKKAGVKAAKE